MSQYKKITISFLPHDSDLWIYIENKKETCNLSEYIRSLIKKDMIYGNNTFTTDDSSIEKILELLSARLPTISNDPEKLYEEAPVSEEMKKTIHSLF
ncbi:hypothetical protein WAX74_12695 [Psychrobacillus sp. FJAT-51614]|uniref:Uncharacterized protein n=1 Tax=Psychrobacillus mangrovi TaxID=3117745 RepID=A0ABU8F696_9BACI